MAVLVREYGSAGPTVVVVHGGPGAAGYLAPVARGLAGSFRVLEPFQRGSGTEPLTVARHVADLHEVVTTRCGDRRPALLGHSWGAMLALAFAASWPDAAAALVLVGCGTFDREARRRMEAAVAARTDGALRRRLDVLSAEVADPDARLRAAGDLLLGAYSCEATVEALDGVRCDARAHAESWADMVRLQDEGVLPAAFASIRAPVLMLHGADDPHPGRMIRDGLRRFLPQLEYREWARCGHYPWLERAVGSGFFAGVQEWLAAVPGYAGGDEEDR